MNEDEPEEQEYRCQVCGGYFEAPEEQDVCDVCAEAT